ncbi:MAG TPA: hypothetical protein VFZ00_01560 [Solirubrobacter sp.]|nr:hypothetical protein [Solirubrobacter sp.]
MIDRDHAELVERLHDAWAELRAMPGGHGHLVDLCLEAAASIRAAGIAAVVVESWRDSCIESDEPSIRMMAHPLACALGAFEGETEPIELGIGDGPAADAIRELAAVRNGTPAS